MAVSIHCCNCKFYDTEEYEDEEVTYEMTYGSCVRFPPKRIDGSTSVFPIVEDDWWCGEFKLKEQDE